MNELPPKSATQPRPLPEIPTWVANEKATYCLQIAQLMESRSLTQIVDLLEILQGKTEKAQMILTLIDTAKSMPIATLNQWLKIGITLKADADRAKTATRRNGSR
jgi:hypothetical protein